MPAGRALRTRRKVALPSGTGIAETHRNDCHPARIIKRIGRELQPVAQQGTRCIVPWDTGFVYLPARCLTDDEQPSLCACRHNRPRHMRQGSRTCLAGCDFIKNWKAEIHRIPVVQVGWHGKENLAGPVRQERQPCRATWEAELETGFPIRQPVRQASFVFLPRHTRGKKNRVMLSVRHCHAYLLKLAPDGETCPKTESRCLPPVEFHEICPSR